MKHGSQPFDEADLHSYVDGQMDLGRRANFIQALASDPAMRAKVEGWKRQNDALTATFGPVLGEQVPVRLLPTSVVRESPRVAVPDPRPDPAASPQTPDLRPPRGPPSGIVAATDLCLSGRCRAQLRRSALRLRSEHVRQQGSVEFAIPLGRRALALRAYEAHETYVTDLKHPVEVPASDEAHLLKWIQHRLSMPIRIPDLRPQGWNLLGGRVLPGELGPAAFLIYGNGVERLGLTWREPIRRSPKSYNVYDNGAGLASVAYWVDEPVGYALTTSRDSGWLERNGAALYQSVRAQARDNASAF